MAGYPSPDWPLSREEKQQRCHLMREREMSAVDEAMRVMSEENAHVRQLLRESTQLNKMAMQLLREPSQLNKMAMQLLLEPEETQLNKMAMQLNKMAMQQSTQMAMQRNRSVMEQLGQHPGPILDGPRDPPPPIALSPKAPAPKAKVPKMRMPKGTDGANAKAPQQSQTAEWTPGQPMTARRFPPLGEP